MRTAVAAVPLRIHPLAMPAFEVAAKLAPKIGAGRPRAVAADGAHLVFAGFWALGGFSATRAPVIERGLTDAEIEAAAWAEVRAIWLILTAPAEALRSFTHDMMDAAPPEVLSDLDLPVNRDPTQALKRLPALARAAPARETVFERARARYRRSLGGGA